MFDRVVFDRTKYGVPLLVDACPIDTIPDFTLERRSHRLGFYEVALITRGQGTLQLDDTAIDIAPRRVVVTGPGEVRRWHLGDRALEGLLVFFEAEFMNEFFRDDRFVERMPLMASDPRSRSPVASPRPFEGLVNIAESMCDEVRALRADSEHALRAQTYRLLVELQRMAAPSLGSGGAPRVNRPLSARFDDAVEASFRSHHRVGNYAEMLGVSARYLNACVRESSGITAREAIGRRQFREACRLLLHTRWSVAAISENLGFSEPSWFIRFFKRHAGATPHAFRCRRESDISVPARDLSGRGAPAHD
jgi:AraC family transcriptional activator of pobA